VGGFDDESGDRLRGAALLMKNENPDFFGSRLWFGVVFSNDASLRIGARGVGTAATRRAIGSYSFHSSTHVSGIHAVKRKTYVAPHYRSAPDSSNSTIGAPGANTNPYTGKEGTKSPY